MADIILHITSRNLRAGQLQNKLKVELTKYLDTENTERAGKLHLLIRKHESVCSIQLVMTYYSTTAVTGIKIILVLPILLQLLWIFGIPLMHTKYYCALLGAFQNVLYIP